MKKAILIELNPWHGECLFQQLLYLTGAHYEVTLICNERLRSQITSSIKLQGITSHFYDFKKLSQVWRCYRFICNSKINTVIFNTAQGSRTLRFLLFPFPSRIHFFGTIHNIKKLTHSLGQKIISLKVHHYYLLADYLSLYFPKSSKLKCQPVNFCTHPDFPIVQVPQKDGDIYVTVAGNIEYKRRDYDSLIQFVKTEKEPSHIKFIILGDIDKKDGPDFLQTLNCEGITDRFIFFHGFVKDELFHSYLLKSDYLLPLIHPNIRDAQSYTCDKISGTFVIAACYGIKMLCQNMFQNIERFNYPLLFYKNIDDIPQIILADKKECRNWVSPFNADDEGRRYTNFLNEE